MAPWETQGSGALPRASCGRSTLPQGSTGPRARSVSSGCHASACWTPGTLPTPGNHLELLEPLVVPGAGWEHCVPTRAARHSRGSLRDHPRLTEKKTEPGFCATWTGSDSVSPTTCGCDLTWKWGLCRCHQAKRRAQTGTGWALNPA